MIHVEREPIPATLSKNQERWTEELCTEWLRYYVDVGRFEGGEIAVEPETPKAKKIRYANPSVKRALIRMFGAKCCYCEGNADAVSYRHVEHFRPQSIYPRLAYQWSNLLYACQRCNSSHKGDRFPIGPAGSDAQPNRASPCDPDGNDTAMLVDPCIDDPAEHFDYEFTEQLYLEDITLVSKTERGAKSREIYGLDREDLADDRRKHVRLVAGWVTSYLLARHSDDQEDRDRALINLRDAVSRTSRYSAMTRAYVASHGIDIADTPQ
jgi:uncharacterized protein (TIGR02646 family)